MVAKRAASHAAPSAPCVTYEASNLCARVLALPLGFDWILGLDGARVYDPAPSPASLSVDAWYIYGMVGCGREGRG
jgi:hypothetical protein